MCEALPDGCHLGREHGIGVFPQLNEREVVRDRLLPVPFRLVQLSEALVGAGIVLLQLVENNASAARAVYTRAIEFLRDPLSCRRVA